MLLLVFSLHHHSVTHFLATNFQNQFWLLQTLARKSWYKLLDLLPTGKSGKKCDCVYACTKRIHVQPKTNLFTNPEILPQNVIFSKRKIWTQICSQMLPWKNNLCLKCSKLPCKSFQKTKNFERSVADRNFYRFPWKVRNYTPKFAELAWFQNPKDPSNFVFWSNPARES